MLLLLFYYFSLPMRTLFQTPKDEKTMQQTNLPSSCRRRHIHSNCDSFLRRAAMRKIQPTSRDTVRILGKRRPSLFASFLLLCARRPVCLVVFAWWFIYKVVYIIPAIFGISIFLQGSMTLNIANNLPLLRRFSPVLLHGPRVLLVPRNSLLQPQRIQLATPVSSYSYQLWRCIY